MKWVIVFFILFEALVSCSSGKKNVGYYYYVEPFKEQEIKLGLLDSSKFIFSDLTGCNQFMYTGKYKLERDSFLAYYVFDSVVSADSLRTNNPDFVFKMRSGDTAWVINKDRVVIQAQSFKISHNTRLNLQKLRLDLLEAYYIDKLGKDGFIKALGDGKSVKVARKKLMECQIGDLDYSSED